MTIVESKHDRLASLQHQLPQARIVHRDQADFEHLLMNSSVVIGAALVPGAHAPQLLSRQDLKLMPARSVFMDVAIDQGGISESSRATSYDEPVYMDTEILHCCLPNFPAAVPRSSTQALSAATLPYVLSMANLGVEKACAQNPALKMGMNIYHGDVVHAAVASALIKK